MENKKIIIYGVGNILNRYKNIVDWDSVVALIDGASQKQGTFFCEKIIDSPEHISEYEFDFIVIFTDNYFEAIKESLIGEFFIDEEKILSYNYFLKDTWFCSDDAKNIIKHYLNFEKCNVIDSSSNGLGRYYFNKEELNSTIYLYSEPTFEHDSLIYDGTMDCKDVKLDTVILWGNYDEDIQKCELELRNIEKVIWIIPHWYKASENFDKQINVLSYGKRKKVFVFLNEIVYFFESIDKQFSLDCNIFVVCHKKYNAIANDIYKTIAVGINKNDLNCDFTDENRDGVAELNNQINECTALYWIWKNTKNKYVGLNHYRRYFYNNEIRHRNNVLSTQKMKNIFDAGYDIILPQNTKLNVSVLANIENVVGKEACNKALDSIRDKVKVLTPEYLQAFDYVMKGNSFYKCNMFVTRNEILNKYCEWLFSFLIDVAEEFDISKYKNQQIRTVGYFAETMFTVWLLNQKYRVYELPVTEIGN